MIRSATLNDLDQIYDIYNQRYSSNDSSQIKYTRSDWEWYLGNGFAIIFVKEINSEIVGVAFAYNMGIWGYLEHIFISIPHRGNKYARELIDHTFNFGKSIGWRIFESCYYDEIQEMKEFFHSIGWNDGGINTRWVYNEK